MEDEALQPRISVAKFDYSVENHFKAMDTIFKLSGESEFDYDQSEIQRLSSSISFLREWRHFCYQPQAIRFACQSETTPRKDVIDGINLPQFSSAAVPKDISDGNKVLPHLSKDFVMYVGGLVWALDWCPRVHQRPDCDINVEFIAVAAHPPESSYHKIGAPLTGRGVIQIWGLLNAGVKNHDVISRVKEKSKKSKKNSRSNETTELKAIHPKRPRGRPRKNPINRSVNLHGNNQHMQAQDVQFLEDSTKLLHTDEISQDTLELVAMEDADTNVKPSTPQKRKRKLRKKPLKDSIDNLESSNKHLGSLAKCKLRLRSQANVTNLPLLSQKCGTSILNSDTSSGCGQDPMTSSENKVIPAPLETDPDSCYISEEVALPRLIMCLAHNGKVAWDVKWRPFDTYADSKHRMGYLAVLLGNGALEVWEVPLPGAIKVIFSTCEKEGADPRFIKLEPVFRCSMLKCGDRQSIPLTVEWSASSPHDLILAGCHDGVVALWKFSANGLLKDTRPLLCFSADTVPIRALAWAPVVSDPESANIIVTAGHKGLKFWDIRDPFRPLWDVNPVQRIIYGLDWLPDPRCVILSFDDGEIQIISLLKAASDVPVTGTPFVGTQLQGLHSYHCSSSSIWSVQVSRLTGMVAYCCSDGTVIRFQLTNKAVEKDPRRNREPHYLCGSLTLEGSVLTVFSPLPDIAFPMKKSSNEWSNTPRSRRGFLAISNQEKRAREQMVNSQTLEEQPLALCYGDDPGSDSGSDGTLVAQKNKHTSQTKGSGKKKPKTDTKQAEIENEEIEVFPPKIVAMHCVRWNMNKGSERWLCYGGAGGIVRCQEIS